MLSFRIHAGGEDGFVPGVMKVYQVSKKKAAADYHSNIDGVQYMDWFRDLCVKVKDKYGPSIIVIDNGKVPVLPFCMATTRENESF